MFDFDPWLTPLEAANPSGSELRNDQRFHDLERLMQPRVEVTRDERNNPISQTTIPVDWHEVLRKAEELRGSGRDLRLLVIVTRALANTRGFAGLADGLVLIARTLEQHWDTMHPALREAVSAREAALRRINALLQLQNGEDGLLGDLRAAVLLQPRGLGPLTGEQVALGTLDARTYVAERAPGASAAEQSRLAAEHDALLARVRAGCAAEADQRAEEYATLCTDCRNAEAALADLETRLNERLGEAVAVTLPELKEFLVRVNATLDRAQPGTGPASAEVADEPTVNPGSALAQSVAQAAASLPMRTLGCGFPERLESRDDVLRCLDLIIAFYDRTEPSSPIPHLAKRVRRMVPMDFLELMEDLAPSGLKEFRVLAGVAEGKGKPASKDKGDAG